MGPEQRHPRVATRFWLPPICQRSDSSHRSRPTPRPVPSSPPRGGRPVDSVPTCTNHFRPRQPRASPVWQVVHDHWTGFRAAYTAHSAATWGPLPAQVDSAVSAFLSCGDCHSGFTRLRCTHCGHEYLLPFTCKQRGLCASCHQRRALDEASNIAEQVYAPVPPCAGQRRSLNPRKRLPTRPDWRLARVARTLAADRSCPTPNRGRPHRMAAPAPPAGRSSRDRAAPASAAAADPLAHARPTGVGSRSAALPALQRFSPPPLPGGTARSDSRHPRTARALRRAGRTGAGPAREPCDRGRPVDLVRHTASRNRVAAARSHTSHPTFDSTGRLRCCQWRSACTGNPSPTPAPRAPTAPARSVVPPALVHRR